MKKIIGIITGLIAVFEISTIIRLIINETFKIEFIEKVSSIRGSASSLTSTITILLITTIIFGLISLFCLKKKII